MWVDKYFPWRDSATRTVKASREEFFRLVVRLHAQQSNAPEFAGEVNPAPDRLGAHIALYCAAAIMTD